MCSETSFLQFAELQTDQGTLIFPMKRNCSLDTFRSHCHTGAGLLAWSLDKVCLQCMRSEPLTSHAHCGSAIPLCPLALPSLHLRHLAIGSGCNSRSYWLCVLIPGWFSPWDDLLLPVSEGPYTGPVQALAKYSSSKYCQPHVDLAAWFVDQFSALVLKSLSDSAPGLCLSTPSLKIWAGPGWAPCGSLENSCAEQEACYKLHPQTFLLQRCQTLPLISSHTLKGWEIQLPPLGMFRPLLILLDVKKLPNLLL